MKLFAKLSGVIDFDDILALVGVGLISYAASYLHPAGPWAVWGAFCFWVGTH